MSQQTARYDEPLDNEPNLDVEKSPNIEQSEPQKEVAKELDKDTPKQSDTQKLELSSEDRRLLDEAAARERFSNEIAMAEKSVPGFDRGKVLHKLEEINKGEASSADMVDFYSHLGEICK